MASFFNIAKIRPLLQETIGEDKAAQSMLCPGSNRSIDVAVTEACRICEIRTNTDLLRAIANGMGDYLREYPAPCSYKQRLWNSCDSWIRRIAAKLDVEAGKVFEEEITRPVVRDLGVDLIKALHDEDGKTKEKLAEELGVGQKTIQTELRALDPSLREGETDIRPLRIAGQELHPKIQYRVRTKGDNPRVAERVYYMKDRLHPIVLQLNTQEAATLLLSLFTMNEATGSLLSREMALDVWCQLSLPGQKRIYEVFGLKDPEFKAFLDEIKEELEENRLVTFHTEEQQRDDNMSIDELLMSSFKAGDTCRIELKQVGNTIRISRARILLKDLREKRWVAIPADEYPDQSRAVLFSTEDVRDIRG